MTGDTTTFHGRCHCGNLTVMFETRLRPEELPVRACGWSFCRSHRARCTSDPAGQASIAVRDPDLLKRYRFGLKTGDFLICSQCGVYLGAVLTSEGRSYATINVNNFPDAETRLEAATSVTYDGESPTDRRARRMARWTPVRAMQIGDRTT